MRRLLEKNAGDQDIIQLICAQKGRPCFDYHVGRGPGVCAGMIDRDDYARNVRRVERFLSGQRRELVDELKADMAEAAADLDFERAGRIKRRLEVVDGLDDRQQFLSGQRRELVDELKADMAEAAADLDFERAGRIKRRLEVVDGLDDRQQVVFPTSVDLDLIGFYREETIAGACVFVVREGRVQRTCEFILDKGFDVDEVELVEGFVKRYYDETSDIPAEVDVACELPDAEVLGAWLASKRGRVCRVHRPQRGEKHRLLQMAEKNARHALMRYMMRTGYSDDRTNQALLQLESARSTGSCRWPRRTPGTRSCAT